MSFAKGTANSQAPRSVGYGMIQRVIAKREIASVLWAFLLSRALVFTLIVLGSQITFLGKVYSNSVWETNISLNWVRVRPELTRVVMVGDAWWYRLIALNGYD